MGDELCGHVSMIFGMGLFNASETAFVLEQHGLVGSDFVDVTEFQAFSEMFVQNVGWNE